MESKPKTLVLADSDFVTGVKKGYYPEYDSQRRINNLEFVSLSEVIENPELWQLDKTDKEEAVFILDPYTQGYIRTDNNDLCRTIITDKAIAFQRALLNMGARCVILTKMIHEAKKETTNVGANGGKKGLFKANASVNHEKGEDIDLSAKLCTLKKSNAPKSIELIKKHLLETGLINDPVLKDLFNELAEAGKINEFKRIDFNFKSELDSALDIAAGLDYGPISANISVKREKIQTYEVKQSLTVYFDDIPEDVEKYMKECHFD